MRKYLIDIIISAMHSVACRSCITLEKQLEYERQRNKELTNSILELIKPKVPVVHTPNKNLIPSSAAAVTFSRQKAEAERADRLAADRLRNSQVVAKESREKEINNLEQELGIGESDGSEQHSNSNG